MSMQPTVTKQPSLSSEKSITIPNGIPEFAEYTTFKIFDNGDGIVSAEGSI